MTTPENVAAFRKAAAAKRRITDTSHGASLNAWFRHDRSKTVKSDALLAAGHKELVGLLWEEDALVQRIADHAAGGGIRRPELAGRLLRIRRDIRSLTKVAPSSV